MTRLEHAIRTLSRWAPAIGTAAITAVLAALLLTSAAVAAGIATLILAALALIDTSVPRS